MVSNLIARWFIDVCTKTASEKYTSLHLAARYNPHNDYEETEDIEEEDQTDSEHTLSTPSLKRQQSSEEVIKFLVNQIGVFVRHSLPSCSVFKIPYSGNFLLVQIFTEMPSDPFRKPFYFCVACRYVHTPT